MTLAAITMTAPEAASPVQMYRATYSPDDNKLRLYAASRLDPETYKKVHDAGFRWAPRQALFVAPAWSVWPRLRRWRNSVWHMSPLVMC